MVNNKKQTALSWLEQELFRRYNFIDDEFIFHQAKQMEREQMINFYGQGVADTSGEITDATKDANQYYELFYGKES